MRPLQLQGTGPDPTFGCGVYASRHLSRGEPIDYDGGVLWEALDFDAAVGGLHNPQQLCSHTLPADMLSPLGYTGPDLVSELNTHAGYNLHYNDPSMYESASHHASEVKANIAAFLVIDLRPSPRPRIGLMYLTTRAVAKGEELLQDWGGGAWAALSESYLDGQARCAHWHHRYLYALLARAEARNVSITAQQLADVQPIPGRMFTFNPAEEGKFGIADYVVDDVGAAGKPAAAYVRWCAEHMAVEESQPAPSLYQGLRVIPDHNVPAAFAGMQCERIEKVDLDSLSQATRTQLTALKTFFQKANKKQRALLDGAAPSKVVMAEVMSSLHPVRWTTNPDTPAYALVVRRGCTIQEDEPVCLYAGRMWTRGDFVQRFGRSELQFYAYDVPLKWDGVDIVKSCKDANLPKPPELVIEALEAGGIGRFINDCWGRQGGTETVNIEPRVVWDASTDTPAIVMTATKRITENEELVCSYGDEFWKVVWRDLRVLQTEFWRRCRARVNYVEDRLFEAGVKLPKLPEVLPGPLFIGAKPLIDPADDTSEDAEVQLDEPNAVEGGRRGGDAAGGGASSQAAERTGDSPRERLGGRGRARGAPPASP